MPTALKILLIAIVTIAGLYDLRFRRIPNWLTLSGVLLGLAMNAIVFAENGDPSLLTSVLAGLKLSALGIGCALLVYVPLYLIRGMGAGDVKLMAAVGAIAGPWNWLCIFIATALLGGCMSLLLIVFKRRFQHTFANVGLIVGELWQLRVPAKSSSELDVRDPRSVGLPHGTMIAVAAIALLIWSPGI